MEHYPGLLEDSDMGFGFWEGVIAVREAVSRELEKLRVAGEIGASLDAEVDLYCSPELYTRLASLGGELRFVLITSEARLHGMAERPVDIPESEVEGLWIVAGRSPHEKCVRCWHRRPDVGQDAEHPQLCGRCVLNVVGDGEQRQYA